MKQELTMQQLCGITLGDQMLDLISLNAGAILSPIGDDGKGNPQVLFAVAGGEMAGAMLDMHKRIMSNQKAGRPLHILIADEMEEALTALVDAHMAEESIPENWARATDIVVRLRKFRYEQAGQMALPLGEGDE